MLADKIRIGDVWTDEDGVEYIVTDIQGTVILSESVDSIDEGVE